METDDVILFLVLILHIHIWTTLSKLLTHYHMFACLYIFGKRKSNILRFFARGCDFKERTIIWRVKSLAYKRNSDYIFVWTGCDHNKPSC